MSLKDLKLKRSYETSADRSNLLNSFYIPVLGECTKYFRIAGFFSSSSLIVASEGIEALINNKGKMNLLISPELSVEDRNVIINHGLNEESPVFKDFYIDTTNPNENLQALAYLLDSNQLTIKIVIPKGELSGIFHEKVGIIFDKEGNKLSFSGSINESAAGWLGNIEEFKVFCSWNVGQDGYVSDDLNKFVDFWTGSKSDLAEVYDIPESVRKNLLKVVPRDIRDLSIMARFQKEKALHNTKFKPFSHQKNAIEMWVNNGYSLMMEMATGTGKTRTAIGCMLKKLEDNNPLFVIVATPQGTLSRQWITEFKELGVELDEMIIADSSNPKWPVKVEKELLDVTQGNIKTAAVFTTHATASNPNFLEIIRRSKRNVEILFICDEAHAIATPKQKKALLSEYEYRIGLTATPERMFDYEGTAMLRKYFGNKSFEFGIYDALHTINEANGKPFLNQYRYKPVFIEMTDDEYAKYKNLTKKIAILQNEDIPDRDKIEKLLERRADILKNASGKLPKFREKLLEIGEENIKDALLFVSPQQIEDAMIMLSSMMISRAKITEEESASKKVTAEGLTERQKFISDFSRGSLQMLVAIKCLDEGIDIKSARIAFLLSNGKNPREYIQRIGRVIRQAPGKEVSEIYDFVVYSPDDSSNKILSKEFERAKIIAQNAMNYEEVINDFMVRGVNKDANQ